MYISKLTKDIIYCVLIFIALLLMFITLQDNIVQNQLKTDEARLNAKQWYSMFEDTVVDIVNNIDSSIIYVSNVPIICDNITHNKQNALKAVSQSNIPTSVQSSKSQAVQEVSLNNEDNTAIVHRGDDISTYYNIPLSYELQDYTKKIADLYGLDVKLVYAVMRTESNYDSTIISNTDDYGIMQINIVNHAFLSHTLNIDDFLDVYDNIRAGCYMLHNAVSQTTTLNEALMVYNLGYGGATEFWNAGIYSTNYSDTVLYHYNNISTLE